MPKEDTTKHFNRKDWVGNRKAENDIIDGHRKLRETLFDIGLGLGEIAKDLPKKSEITPAIRDMMKEIRDALKEVKKY